MTTATVFLIGMAVLIAAVLVLTAFSGRMSVRARDLLVRVAVLIFYPVFILVSTHAAWSAFGTGDGWAAAMNALVVLGLTVAGVQIWRNPSLRRSGSKSAK